MEQNSNTNKKRKPSNLRELLNEDLEIKELPKETAIKEENKENKENEEKEEKEESVDIERRNIIEQFLNTGSFKNANSSMNKAFNNFINSNKFEFIGNLHQQIITGVENGNQYIIDLR